MISGITVLPAFFCDLDRGLEDRAGLHLVDLGIGDAEPAAAVAEHRVGLVQLARRAPRSRPTSTPRSLADLRHVGFASCGRNSCSGGSSRRMVTGRPSMISKSSTKSSRWNGRSLASAARRPFSSSARIICAHGDDAVAAEEHVLGAAQADALGAELARRARRRAACRRWCGPQRADLVGPVHQRGEVAGQLGLHGRHDAEHDLAGGAVERDDVARLDHRAARP